jgi:hypothetical protein
MGSSQNIPVRVTSLIFRLQEHDQSISSNHRNLLTTPLTKHTTNMAKGSRETPTSYPGYLR